MAHGFEGCDAYGKFYPRASGRDVPAEKIFFHGQIGQMGEKVLNGHIKIIHGRLLGMLHDRAPRE